MLPEFHAVPHRNDEARREHVTRFVTVCGRFGLNATVTDPTGVVMVNAPGNHKLLAEQISIRPVIRYAGELHWCWSWGHPIGHVNDADRVVEQIHRVISVPVSNSTANT